MQQMTSELIYVISHIPHQINVILIFLKLSYNNKFLPNIHLEAKDHHQEVQHAAHQSLCHPICICFEISLELFQNDQKWNTQTVTSNCSFFSDRLHVTFNL